VVRHGSWFPHGTTWLPILLAWRYFALRSKDDEATEKIIIRQPPIREKDDYDSENSWISDRLPSNSRRRRRGDGRWEVGEWREKRSASETRVWRKFVLSIREIEKFIIRQPPIGEKDDYDSENSWISDGLPSSSRRRRRGDGRWEMGEWREK